MMASHSETDPFIYQVEADKLLLGIRFLSDVRLDELVQAVNRAETLGPIIDPTRYKQALDRGHMAAVGQLADEARSLVARFEKHMSEAGVKI